MCIRDSLRTGNLHTPLVGEPFRQLGCDAVALEPVSYTHLQQYMWALAPSVTYLSVAITPRQSADHANVENRWEMFVDGHYVIDVYNRQRVRYAHEYDQEDHERLLVFLQTLKGKVVLSLSLIHIS